MNTSKRQYDEQLIGMLQFLFITTNKHDLRKVAAEMNMDYHDLYPYIVGRRTMPTEILRRITEITKDKVFLDVAYAGSPIQFIWREKVLENGSSDATLGFFNLAEKFGKIYGEMESYLLNGAMQPSHRKLVINELAEMIKKAQHLLEIMVKEG